MKSKVVPAVSSISLWTLYVTTPIIYAMIVPAVLMDLMATIYQRLCFPIYGIEIVSRKSYMQFDRHLLPALKWYQRINCEYCAYFNGVMSYVAEIAARTEEYWCPIKHQKRPVHPHRYYARFSDYERFEKREAQDHADEIS